MFGRSQHQRLISKIIEGSRKFYNDPLTLKISRAAYNAFVEQFESAKEIGSDIEYFGVSIDMTIIERTCEIWQSKCQFEVPSMDLIESMSMTAAIGCIAAEAAEKYIRNNWSVYNPHIGVYIGTMGATEAVVKYKGTGCPIDENEAICIR